MAIEIFENVTDVIREAARIPQDRRLTNGWKDVTDFDGCGFGKYCYIWFVCPC
ncbi:MAG: hypothetical protein H0U18_04500 [Pyrinomonadaceae bacterium]|nr:hypothetical protein [Pyrinomonadaceae bacterium]